MQSERMVWISVRMSEQMRAKLGKIAKKADSTVSETIRQLLKKVLK